MDRGTLQPGAASLQHRLHHALPGEDPLPPTAGPRGIKRKCRTSRGHFSPRPTPPPASGHRHPRQRPQPYRQQPRRPTCHSRRPLTLPSPLPSKGPEGPPEVFRRAFGRSSATSNPTEVGRLIPERRHHPYHRRYLEYSEKIIQRLAILQSRQKLGLDSPLARIALEHSPGNIRTET